MTTSAQEWTDEERTEKIAETLTSLGLEASAQNTGGDVFCVVIPRDNGGEISWGTADIIWGAAITDEEGGQISSISADWPSDSEDIAAIAQALLGPSLRNGAVLASA